MGVVGTAPITNQLLKGGVAISGATSSYLTFPKAQPAATGRYSGDITVPAATVTSSAATLTVPTAGGVPVPITIIQQPVAVTASVHSSATFFRGRERRRNPHLSVAQKPGSNPRRDHLLLYGQRCVQPSDSANYDVVVTNAFSAITSFETPLTVVPVTIPSRLTNVSVLGSSGLAGQGFAVGFVVSGSGTETTLVRAVGPTLSNFGLTGLLAGPAADPVLASGQCDRHQ